MEKLLKLRIPKTGHVIYGKLRGALTRPLVILVHGLSEHMDGMLQYNGARFLEKKGFATFRFNLYDWQEGARSLNECTLQTNADDLDVVVAYFRKRGVKKVFVVGHSYGGPAILMSKKRAFDGAVLWDPSNFANIDMSKWAQHVPEIDAYRLHGGYDILVSNEHVASQKTIDWNHLTEGWTIPLKIIAAGKGMLISGCKEYHKAAQGPKELVILKNAGHMFSEDGMAEKLFGETVGWFRGLK